MQASTATLRGARLLGCTCQHAGRSGAQSRRLASTQVDKVVEAAAAAPVDAYTIASQQSTSYPFSESIIAPPLAIPPRRKEQPLSLMDRVNQSLLLPSTSPFRGLFQKHSPERIPPGSIISVETYSGGATPATSNSTSAFAGVLMAVKRRHQGVDDAFTVRANVGKPGVGTEVRFDVNSPWIKSIKVLRRNEDFRRQKLYYIRRSDKFLSGVQGAIRSSAIAAAALANDSKSTTRMSPPTKSSSKKTVKGGKK